MYSIHYIVSLCLQYELILRRRDKERDENTTNYRIIMIMIKTIMITTIMIMMIIVTMLIVILVVTINKTKTYNIQQQFRLNIIKANITIKSKETKTNNENNET